MEGYKKKQNTTWLLLAEFWSVIFAVRYYG